MSRFAFTIIELIVTIVILGFIASALPTMLLTDQKARDDSVVQEAIYASAAKMSQILSYKWDEASNEDNSTISGAKVLDVVASANTDIAFARSTGKFRIGHFQQTGRRTLFNNNTLSLGLGLDAGDVTADDIDDANAIAAAFLTPSTTAGGYKENYTIDVTTSYVVDRSVDAYVNSTQNGFEFENISLNPTNIKRILVTVKDANNETLFSMRTYSSNIGETSVFSRIY